MSNTLTNKVVADKLGIGLSTLKRWIATLEDAGYSFLTTGMVRKLTDQDLLVLKKMKMFSDKPNNSLEQAATKAVEWHQKQMEKQAADVLTEGDDQKPPIQQQDQMEPLHLVSVPSKPEEAEADHPPVVQEWTEEDQMAIAEFDHLMVHLIPGLFWKGKETQELLVTKWTAIRDKLLLPPTSASTGTSI